MQQEIGTNLRSTCEFPLQTLSVPYLFPIRVEEYNILGRYQLLERPTTREPFTLSPGGSAWAWEVFQKREADIGLLIPLSH